ncbi:pilus assembly protein [Pseudarthrobacter sp. RMG13]|uniref:Pilus assembly protein n=1 Tax=Pseudarthrobacter humi TaxID=2952523 RepID=A0ABT1LJ03_9MICC|nr:TadE/TadG family type IV pilus assembly protein [Pseudarthrobacter humi]MCP8998425.1 pilus assembly protein [Pseudarthrobacter humi]
MRFLQRFRDSRSPERGAVAVEFALVLPIFVLLVFGIAEYGRAFNIQVSLSEAAREASRYAAIHSSDTGYTPADARSAGIAAAPSVPLVPADIAIAYSPGSACAADSNVIVTITYSVPYMTGLPNLVPGMSPNLTVSSRGVMRCAG